MVSDKDLLIDALTIYKDVDLATAARNLAHDYGLSYDSVRGRLSRANQDISVRTQVTKFIATNSSELPPAVQRQLKVIELSGQEWDDWQFNQNRRGMFISDLHMPYTRWDAYELAMTIGEWWKPHIISALNDSLDNKGYGKFDDDDPIYKQLWRSDFSNSISALDSLHSDYRSILADGGKLAGLMGNHDKWVFKYWRRVDKQTAERNIANFMETLYHEHDVMMFSRGVYEPPLHLSRGLVWVHGLSAAKNHNTNAKKAFAYFMGDDGRAKSVVQGHTHRAIQVNGLPLGYRGVTFTNSGHLRDTKPEWLAHEAMDWVMAIVLVEYNPFSWESKSHLIVFEQKHDKLVAQFRGMEWEVPIDTSKP